MIVSAIMLECQCLHGTKLIAEERDRRNLSNYRTWAYVNDITKQLQTQTFSFQQSCINQIMTKSIGIRLKKIIGDKKAKTNLSSGSVRKTSLIVHSGFKTIKNPLAAHIRGRLCGDVSNSEGPHKSLLSVVRWGPKTWSHRCKTTVTRLRKTSSNMNLEHSPKGLWQVQRGIKETDLNG